jgi:hypothetical protein
MSATGRSGLNNLALAAERAEEARAQAAALAAQREEKKAAKEALNAELRKRESGTRNLGDLSKGKGGGKRHTRKSKSHTRRRTNKKKCTTRKA